MASIKFDNYIDDVNNAIADEAIAFLHEACGELQAQVIRNTKRAKGETADGWSSPGYQIDESKLEGYVGNPKQNAIWEEFGTGDYALNRNGRIGGWWIKVGYSPNEISPDVVEKYRWDDCVFDKNGNISYVFTHGKSAREPFTKAKNRMEPIIKKIAEAKFKGLNGNGST